MGRGTQLRKKKGENKKNKINNKIKRNKKKKKRDVFLEV